LEINKNHQIKVNYIEEIIDVVMRIRASVVRPRAVIRNELPESGLFFEDNDGKFRCRSLRLPRAPAVPHVHIMTYNYDVYLKKITTRVIKSNPTQKCRPAKGIREST
jgi:hypothetical protein